MTTEPVEQETNSEVCLKSQTSLFILPRRSQKEQDFIWICNFSIREQTVDWLKFESFCISHFDE